MAKIEKIIGIDVSKETFSFARRENSKIITGEYPNTLEAIADFMQTLDTDTVCVMEATGVYHTKLSYTLHENGFKVAVLNPLTAKNYARMQMKRTKTDKSDSKLILEYAETIGVTLWSPKPKYCIDIQQYLTLQEAINKQIVMFVGQLEALENSFHQNADCIKYCHDMISILSEDLKNIESKIMELVTLNDKENFSRLTSIPGLGKKTACLLIALTQSFKNFENYKQVMSYFGLCPRIYQSGTSINGKAKICKIGFKNIRKMLYMCAVSAKVHNDKCKDLYDRLVEKGKAKKLALIAVANKLVKQSFSLIKNKQFFQKNYVQKFGN